VFVYRSRFLTRGEVWFENEPDASPVDWILYRQRSTPVPKSRWSFFYTRLIDLCKSEEQLLAEMEERTVSKIRQAKEQDKIKITCESLDGPNATAMDEFEAMWNRFAATKGTGRFPRDWVNRMIERRSLYLAAAIDPEGELLAYQATYLDKERAQELMVVSPFRENPDIATRRKINRANCLLHWDTMLRMKEKGFRLFDFGGWYPGQTNIELLGMNAFKKSFGGQVVREYQCERIQSLRGWLVLTAARIVQRTGSPLF
jgi:hypothetical protein